MRSSKRWLAELGAEEAEKLLEADNTPAPTVLRVNRRRVEPEHALNVMRARGVAVEPGAVAPDAIRFSCPELHPGGCTWSQALGAFLVSSQKQGKLVLVEMDGRCVDLLDHPLLITSTAVVRISSSLFESCETARLTRSDDSAEMSAIISVWPFSSSP